MKSNFYSVGLFFVIIMFVSCDSNTVDLKSDINYWRSNTLAHEHLNGKVKTVNYGNGMQIDSYNEAGYITQSVSNGFIVITTTYNYATTGELTSTVLSYLGMNQTYSTIYEYQPTGKFMAFLIPDVEGVGFNLIPDLKSVTDIQGRKTDYQLSGNTALIITPLSNDVNDKDTTEVTYSGQYPSCITTTYTKTKDFKYYDNGMYKSYTVEYSGADNSSMTKYYFRADDKFQLVDSIVSISPTTHSTQVYTYDANKNVIHTEKSGTTYDYTYVYDSNNNWISKKTITKTSDSSGYLTLYETRTITYW